MNLHTAHILRHTGKTCQAMHTTKMIMEGGAAECRAEVLSAERVDRECRERREGGGELARGDGAAEEVVDWAWGPAAVRPAERRGVESSPCRATEFVSVNGLTFHDKTNARRPCAPSLWSARFGSLLPRTAGAAESQQAVF